MTELIKQYRFEARRLREHIKKLNNELDSATSREIIKRLRIRILLLESERFEILRDIRDMKRWL